MTKRAKQVNGSWFSQGLLGQARYILPTSIRAASSTLLWSLTRQTAEKYTSLGLMPHKPL